MNNFFSVFIFISYMLRVLTVANYRNKVFKFLSDHSTCEATNAQDRIAMENGVIQNKTLLRAYKHGANQTRSRKVALSI